MKKLLVLVFGLCTVLLAQEDEAKRRVELPIKTAAASPPPEKFDLAKTGIPWHKGIEAVAGRGKPILLLQILGNYDEVYC